MNLCIFFSLFRQLVTKFVRQKLSPVFGMQIAYTYLACYLLIYKYKLCASKFYAMPLGIFYATSIIVS